MRNLAITVLLMFAGLSCWAQSSLFSNTIKSYANWEIVDKEAVWAYVFPSKIKNKTTLEEAVVVFLKQNPTIQNVVMKNTEITADITNLKIDYKKYGGSSRYTSQAFVNGIWSGKLVIEIVDGSYEAIVSKMAFDVEHKGLNSGDGIMGANGGRGSWTSSVLNKDHQAFKEGKKVDIELFNKALMDIFDLKK